MDAWTIYLVMQADSLVALFSFVCVCMGFAFALLPIAIDVMCIDDDKRKAVYVKYVSVMMICGLLAALTPSTKTLAAMLILPELAKNEQIQNEAGELYSLAKEALKQAVQPSK